MLTTTIFAFKKSQTTDASSALRTAPNDNADLLEGLLDRRGYAEVLTSQSTSSVGPVDLTTAGPSVTISVPTNGLVEVFAAVDITGSGAAAGNVFLLEDGGSLGIILARTTASAAAVYTAPGFGSIGTSGRVLAGWLTFPVAAGNHTYKLQYGSNSGSLPFANRKLWVRVRTS